MRQQRPYERMRLRHTRNTVRHITELFDDLREHEARRDLHMHERAQMHEHCLRAQTSAQARKQVRLSGARRPEHDQRAQAQCLRFLTRYRATLRDAALDGIAHRSIQARQVDELLRPRISVQRVQKGSSHGALFSVRLAQESRVPCGPGKHKFSSSAESRLIPPSGRSSTKPSLAALSNASRAASEVKEGCKRATTDGTNERPVRTSRVASTAAKTLMRTGSAAFLSARAPLLEPLGGTARATASITSASNKDRPFWELATLATVFAKETNSSNCLRESTAALAGTSTSSLPRSTRWASPLATSASAALFASAAVAPDRCAATLFKPTNAPSVRTCFSCSPTGFRSALFVTSKPCLATSAATCARTAAGPSAVSLTTPSLASVASARDTSCGISGNRFAESCFAFPIAKTIRRGCENGD